MDYEMYDLYVFALQYFQKETRYHLDSMFAFQVLNTATVTPARDHFLILTTQVPPVIVTASPIKNRHIASSCRGRSDSAWPSRRLRCGSWSERTSGGHIWWVKTRRNWCRDSGSQLKIWRWVSLNYVVKRFLRLKIKARDLLWCKLMFVMTRVAFRNSELHFSSYIC